MDHGEDVLAFGAHTPSFLKVEPYVADAAEPTGTIEQPAS